MASQMGLAGWGAGLVVLVSVPSHGLAALQGHYVPVDQVSFPQFQDYCSSGTSVATATTFLQCGA